MPMYDDDPTIGRNATERAFLRERGGEAGPDALARLVMSLFGSRQPGGSITSQPLPPPPGYIESPFSPPPPPEPKPVSNIASAPAIRERVGARLAPPLPPGLNPNALAMDVMGYPPQQTSQNFDIPPDGMPGGPQTTPGFFPPRMPTEMPLRTAFDWPNSGRELPSGRPDPRAVAASVAGGWLNQPPAGAQQAPFSFWDRLKALRGGMPRPQAPRPDVPPQLESVSPFSRQFSGSPAPSDVMPGAQGALSQQLLSALMQNPRFFQQWSARGLPQDPYIGQYAFGGSVDDQLGGNPVRSPFAVPDAFTPPPTMPTSPAFGTPASDRAGGPNSILPQIPTNRRRDINTSPFEATNPRVPGMARGGYPQLYNQPIRRAFESGGPERYVPIDGDGGRADRVNAMLSGGEYVMDAETLSLLGDGDNEAGAEKMDKLRTEVRKHKGKALAKGKISPDAKKSAAEYLVGDPISAGLRARMKEK